MIRLITGIAALLIAGAAALPVPASAMEQGITKAQSTELSSQRRWYRHHYVRRHYWGPRYTHRYWGPRYYARPYWAPRYRYGYYGYPYRYRPYGYPYYRRPGLAFGIGPFGFGVF